MPQLYTEPIAGYRTWLMDEHEPVIASVIHPTIWTPYEDSHSYCRKNLAPDNKLVKGKRRTRHKVPSLKCQCGFWAYDSYENLRTATNYCWGSMMKSVRGVIIAWGRIQLTELGFRAEYARPVGLLRWNDRRKNPKLYELPKEEQGRREFWNSQLEKIAEVYKVPLVDTEQELTEIANELGSPILR